MDYNSSFPKPEKSGLSEENYIFVHSKVPEIILILRISELGLSDQTPLFINVRMSLNSRRHQLHFIMYLTSRHSPNTLSSIQLYLWGPG